MSPDHVATSHAVSVQSLGSGSSGNAFLISYGTETLLVDCGVGIRTLTQAFRARGLAFGDLSAVLVTHEHSDHIRTLPKVVTNGTPLYATEGTARSGGLRSDRLMTLVPEQPVSVAGLTVWPLPVRHDATEPAGFLLEAPGGVRIAVLTDLGSWHEALAPYVAASDLIVLEANHDEEMLRRGPYPAYLKRRVASDVGHLSNRACGVALAGTLRGSARRPQVWLAHLSEHNNRPELAVETVQLALTQGELELDVFALPRTTAGPIWTPGSRQRTPVPTGTTKPLRQLALEF